MRNLILLILFVAVTDVNAASTPAISTATTSAATTAAMYHVMHSNHSSRRAAKHGISKAFRNEAISKSDIVVPCKVYWISAGIFETDGRVDVEKTLRKCEKEKTIIEQMNGVKYSFGTAKTYDPYFGKVYLELIQND